MISVFVASRLNGINDRPWLLDALDSVFAQQGHAVDEVVVGLDAGVEIPQLGDARVRFVNSDGNNQAKAVTAALRECRGDIICGLEDDDIWAANKLAVQLPWLDLGYSFVSSCVAEVHYSTGDRLPNRPNAFISSWVMTREVLDTVGAYFSDDIFYHVDIEWLGRLNEHPELKRVHLVEPEAMPPYNVIPLLNMVGQYAHVRGVEACPLVRRAAGYMSRGMECNIDPVGKLRLQADGEAIVRRWGAFPW